MKNAHPRIRQIEKRGDNEEVGGHDQVHELLGGNIDKIRIPLGNDVAHVATLQGSLNLPQAHQGDISEIVLS